MTPLLLQAAFTIESLAHLQGHEELLPQAEHLRWLHETMLRYRDFDRAGNKRLHGTAPIWLKKALE